jgi:hypothetical protein
MGVNNTSNYNALQNGKNRAFFEPSYYCSTILFFWKVSNSKNARPAIPDGRCRFLKDSRGVARVGCRFLSQPFVEWVFVISPHFGRFFSVWAVFLRKLWSADFHSTN